MAAYLYTVGVPQPRAPCTYRGPMGRIHPHPSSTALQTCFSVWNPLLHEIWQGRSIAVDYNRYSLSFSEFREFAALATTWGKSTIHLAPWLQYACQHSCQTLVTTARYEQWIHQWLHGGALVLWWSCSPALRTASLQPPQLYRG